MKKNFVYTPLLPKMKDLTTTGFCLVVMCICLYLTYDFYHKPEVAVKFLGAHLTHPLTWMAFSVIAGVFLLFAILSFFYMKWSNAKNIKKIEIMKNNSQEIVCDENSFSYTKDDGEKKRVQFTEIHDLLLKTNTEEGEEEDNYLVVYWTQDNEGDYEMFRKIRFENEQKYQEFIDMMYEKAVNREK